jgi:hypothetical protein
MAGPSFILMFLSMPETSADAILLRRAQRLRALTGDSRLKSASEIKATNVVFSAVVWDALIKPIQITVLDPAVLFVNVYTSFVYATSNPDPCSSGNHPFNYGHLHFRLNLIRTHRRPRLSHDNNV